MEKKVITQIIKYYGAPCPTFKYENPLLDKNIADLLAKGFIKLLNQNLYNVDNRDFILRNIRKSCKVEPSGHLYMDDNIIELLRNAYEELPDNNIYRDLDTFLIRNLKEINIGSLHPPSFNPDVIQALRNLNNNNQKINDILVKDMIYWNVDSQDNGYMGILNSIWNEEFMCGLCENGPDDVSIKMKPIIEKTILCYATEMMSIEIVDDDWFFESENIDLVKLIKICSISRECFQISCSIMNNIFIRTNFDIKMSEFILQFIDAIITSRNSVNMNVKNLSQLYPAHLQHIVVLLDINSKDLNGELQATYQAHTLKQLSSLHTECESDLIMLLSHFSHWFNIYYDYNKTA